MKYRKIRGCDLIKQVRNITSWICDGKFVKAMSIAKRIFLAFINISFLMEN